MGAVLLREYSRRRMPLAVYSRPRPVLAQRNAAGRRLGGALVGAVALTFAVARCGDPDPGPQSCGEPGPAFVITVRASSGPLPLGLEVQATYGAGQDVYRLGSPTVRNEVLFCGLADETSGEGGASGQGGASGAALQQESLRCELWTDSSVSLRVQGRGYVPLEAELEPTVDERCGVMTTFEDFLLEPPAEETD